MGLKRTATVVAGIASIALLSGCGGDPAPTDGGSMDAGAGCSTVQSTGTWTVYDNPYMDGGANPAKNVAGTVKSCTEGGVTRVVLNVTGAGASRAYGGHVHVADCATGMAGGHYRADAGAGATSTNEVWVDFTSTAAGAGTADVKASFVVRPGEAKSVVIHDHTTDSAGAAGAKLACINVPF
jgi:Cu-Zn family superoxide dismutase